MLWLRVAAWLVVWLVVRDWVAAREVLGHRRCVGWLGGDGGCGTSVGEGTARGGRLLVVTRCAPCSAAAPVCCHSRKLAGAEDIRNPLRYFLMNRSSISYFYSNSALGGSNYPHLADGGSANVTTGSLPPLA